MLSLAQINALATLVGRQFMDHELAQLAPLVDARNDVEVAAMLSVGRVKHGPTAIGPGTVLSVMGERGGEFLDAITVLGQRDRNVYWGMDPVRRGALDLSVPAARSQLEGLKEKMPEYVIELDKLLTVGVVADPIDYNAVSDALNVAEGRMTL